MDQVEFAEDSFFKKLKEYGLLKQTISCVRQILLGLFLNTWTQI